jgi:hypothetical protein
MSKNCFHTVPKSIIFRNFSKTCSCFCKALHLDCKKKDRKEIYWKYTPYCK